VNGREARREEEFSMNMRRDWRGGEVSPEELETWADFVPPEGRTDVAKHLRENPCRGLFKVSPDGSGPQDRCRCGDCGAFIYCVPKHETGKAVRQVGKREGLKQGQRERILQRDGAECAICETKSPGVGGWHIDHCVSVKDCMSYGFTAEDYNYDGNLCVLCEPCNLGKSGESLIDTKLIKLFLRHNRAKRETRP
jgi:5-methylcytosine-specific restriction endonuclease McrA